MKSKDILEKIKNTVHQTDASAKVILYGSRARGNAKKDSDWDLLILVNKPKVTLQDEKKFIENLYDVELKTNQAISVIAVSRKEWNTKYSVIPLYESIKKEGIVL